MQRVVVFFLLTIFCATSQTVVAQGFSIFNGRNHPELDWQQAETEHFKIMYPAHLAGIEIEAASIAEATYTALSENLDVTFDDKIRMYLSDEDEILNGFAISPLGFTNIWVHVNDVAASWSGNTKWLRTVISHEIAHLFHGRSIRSNVGLFAYFLGDPMPGFWTEGLAQYETELWDANRGDRWLRVAVLDDRLSYEDGRSAWNGRLLYASGNAQLRYLASQYGDSTITKILHHKKETAFGLIKHHDFYTAFQDVTGKSYRSFFDEWRRHVNVYYNTMAGQMENADSLAKDPISLPGQYLDTIQYNADSSAVAVVSLASINRPVRRLYVLDGPKKKKSRIVADGSINTPISWSPDGELIAFSRRTRAKNGSLINDLYMVSRKGKSTTRLTRSRRASSPAFSPDGKQLAFIGSEAGTANVFLLDLATRQESRITSFSGDVQLASIAWHHPSNQIVVGRFDKDGSRDILILDPETGAYKEITPDGIDDQFPIWSPDGAHIAVTSLADRVPNVFVYNVENESRRRVTNVITGATAHDWLPADSTHPAGRLVVTTSSSKLRDVAYVIDPERVPYEVPVIIPPVYREWTTHAPPAPIASSPPTDPQLITGRSEYKSLKNLVHLLSFGLPYYNESDDWGLVGATSWTEPLGHHTFGATASVSFPSFRENSFFLVTYLNNQLKPSIGFSGYSLLPTAVAYGNRYLIDGVSGGDISLDLPLDIAVRPYTSTRLSFRLQYLSVTRLDEDWLEDLPDGLLPPNEGEKAELQIGFTRKTQRPYSGNIIHPLDGLGVKAQITAGEEIFGSDVGYVEGDLSAFAVIPAFQLNRLMLYGRAIYTSGRLFNQDRPGFARFDDVQITAPQFGMLAFSDAVRVRGFREFAYGDRLLFGSAEYRMPFLPSLQTTLLGLLSLRSTTLTGFVDAGIVWNDGERVTRRVGVGAEIKNAVVFGGALQLMHAIGIAQPASDLGTSDNYEIYYRVRATLPF